MRVLRFTAEDIEQTTVVDGQVTEFTGTDTDTAERVTVKVSDASLANTMIAYIGRMGHFTQPWANFQVVRVESPGEWDSPGTSPEE